MRNSNVPFRRSLLAAAVGTAMLGATVGAQAVTVLQFAPGAVDPAANATNAIIAGATANPASLDTLTKFDIMNWAARTSVGTLTEFWPIVVSTGGDSVMNAGDAFTEAFTFQLISTQLAGVKSFYGLSTNILSHVFMNADLAGTLKNDFATTETDLGNLNLNYTKAMFTMFFDADGDLTTAGDQTVFARFGNDVPLVPPANGAGDGSTVTGLSTLVWTVNFDAAVPGTFADENGNELATGAAFTGPGIVAGDGLKEVNAGLFKITRQAVKLALTEAPAGFTNGFNVVDANTTMIAVASQAPATGTSEFTVPEPATLGLLGAGLMGFGAAARRRRKARDEG